MTKCARAVIFAAAGISIWGQAPPAAPAFEVASVKRNLSGGNGGEIRQPRGSFTARNSTLQGLIRYAYGVADYQIQGPTWMGVERYDISAKVDANADNKTIKLMLQSLLTARLGLQVRRDVKQLPLYALLVAKGGIKLPVSQPAESTSVASTSVASTNHSIRVNRATLALLATTLSGQMDRPVIDATEVTGTFDINLEWTPDVPAAEGVPSGPSVFTALQEQLGLRLESRTGPVEVIVVDHADKIPSGN